MTTEITGSLNQLLAWVAHKIPMLLQSKSDWKIVIDGGAGGEIRFRVEQYEKGQITPNRRQALEERRR